MDDQSLIEQEGAHHSGKRSGAARLVLLDIVLPLVVFQIARNAGVAEVWSLVLSGLPPAAGVFVDWQRRRQVEVIGVVVLGGIALTVATFLFARSSLLDQRVLEARNVAIRHGGDINGVLDAAPDEIEDAVRDVDTEVDGFAVLLTSESFPERTRNLFSPQDYSLDDLPDSLVEEVR